MKEPKGFKIEEKSVEGFTYKTFEIYSSSSEEHLATVYPDKGEATCLFPKGEYPEITQLLDKYKIMYVEES